MSDDHAGRCRHGVLFDLPCGQCSKNLALGANRWEDIAKELYLALRAQGSCRCQQAKFWTSLPASTCRMHKALQGFEIASGCVPTSDS